jgi:hypothetical protein
LPGAQLHLDQDSLILWQSALRNALTIESVGGAPGLFDIFPLAVGLLAENLDLLGKIVGIHESYYLLQGSLILQVRRQLLLIAAFTFFNGDSEVRTGSIWRHPYCPS